MQQYVSYFFKIFYFCKKIIAWNQETDDYYYGKKEKGLKVA